MELGCSETSSRNPAAAEPGVDCPVVHQVGDFVLHKHMTSHVKGLASAGVNVNKMP